MDGVVVEEPLMLVEQPSVNATTVTPSVSVGDVHAACVDDAHNAREEPPMEIWGDAEARVFGFLKGRLYGAVRTPATPQSLNLQALNYLAKNEKHLPLALQHPEEQARLVGKLVAIVLCPGTEENALVHLYSTRGPVLQQFNACLQSMADPRQDMRRIWAISGIVAIVAGAGALGVAALRARSIASSATKVVSTVGKVAQATKALREAAASCRKAVAGASTASKILGGALIGVGAVGVISYGVMRAVDWWKNNQRKRWY